MRVALAAVVAGMACAPADARADVEGDGAGSSLLAAGLGVVTAVTPLGIGTLMIASGHDRDTRNAGVFVAQSGFAAAPILAHGAVDEWGRGAVFALPPIAAEVGMVPVFLSYPDVLRRSPVGIQYLYAGFFGLSVFSGAFGIVDVLGAPARAVRRDARARVQLVPLVGAVTGAAIGGEL